jgi:uncharacterized protein
MSAQPVIDAFEFAESGGSLRGKLPLSSLPRLRDALADTGTTGGDLDYAVAGVRDDKGRPALRVEIRGCLQVRCQRCLGVLELPVAIDSTLVLAHSLQEMEGEPAEADGTDWVLGGSGMRVGELLEDELLLAVPYAPRHEHCSAANAGVSADEGGSSPFAGLKSLVGDRPAGGGTKNG